jgi:hypothetical protein
MSNTTPSNPTPMVSPVQIFNPSARPITRGQPDLYTYTADFLALAPNAVQTFIIQIDASAQFLWTASSFNACQTIGTSTYAWQTNPIPQVRILITDTGSAKQLMSNPVYINSMAGSNNGPLRNIHPRFFDKSSAIQIQATSDDGTTWGHLQLNLIGFRIYG